MLVKQLKPDALDGRRWSYYDSPIMQIDEKKAEEFANTFPKMKKETKPSQEEFYILSNATLQ